MTVGVLSLELAIYEAFSLKDKRRVIKSAKDKIAHRFNVSVAEVDHLDSHRRATLGLAMVSNESRYVHGAFDKIIDLVRTCPGITLVDAQRDIY